MPVRPRRRRRAPVMRWTPGLAIALDLGPVPESMGGPSDDVLRQAWTLFGNAIAASWPRADSRPWGFWKFAAGVPPELRGDDRPRLRLAGEPPPDYSDLEAARRAWIAEQRRAR